MELKVREMTELENKSTQQVEKELLDKHEAQQENKQETNTVEAKEEPEVKEVEQTETTEATNEPVQEKEVVEETTKEPVQEPQLDDTKVLSYIEQRYGKQIDSFDELLAEREKAEELPDDVAAYFKYKKETGRGISDYVKLQRDYSEMNPDSLLREYYSITEEGLDAEDIQMMMDDFSYDEEVDEPAQIKKLNP